MKKIREYSVPLIAGVVVAIVCANVAPEWYSKVLHTSIGGGHGIINLHWLVNDIFMVFFFGIAGVEIVTSLSPGGPLNPIKKAVTPLMATAGGVVGPIALFFILNSVMGDVSWLNGWGITTATDIALAWLIAKIVFGKAHPAVSFLLLLAVADDAIGLIIIAVFYTDPSKPIKPLWLLCVVAGILLAFLLRKKNFQSFWPYILIGGIPSWIGLYMTGVHPALSLVFIVPFLPQTGPVVKHHDEHGVADASGHSALHQFEHKFGKIVDFGLFFFGFANAGVAFASMSNLTWIIMLSIIVGKTVGISLFTWFSYKVLKCGLPDGMQAKDVPIAGVVAGVGLTVALFVAQSAYTDMTIQGAAKMGALFTVAAAIIAIMAGRIAGVEKKHL